MLALDRPQYVPFHKTSLSYFGTNLFNRCHKLSHASKQQRDRVRIELTVDHTTNYTLTPSAGDRLNNFASKFS